MDINLENTSLRRADISDWPQLADITAEAFSEDPVNRWLFGSERAIKSAFRVLARDIYRYIPLNARHVESCGGPYGPR
jgi:hypothetical protein